MPNKSTDQLIEEAVERLKKIRSTHGTYCGGWHDMDNVELDLCGECQAIKEFIDKKVEPFLTKQLNLIATKSAEDSQIYLFADNFLKSWGRVFNAKQEYEYIERTRKTRKQVLREVELFCRWTEESLFRTRAAMEMIKRLSSGEKVSVDEIAQALSKPKE